MGRKPLALVAALLGAAVGLGLLWRALGSRPVVTDPAPQAVEEGAREVPAAAPSALESAEGLGRAPDRSKRAAEIAAHTESFPMDGAAWVAGRVVFPDGSPPDETLEVWAFEKEIAIGLSPSVDDAPALVRSGRLEKGWWSRRSVESSGGFRVPLPKGTTAAAIVLDGRYLYLEDDVRVDAAALGKELVLEPKLGAWLVGRCTIPPTAESADSPVGAAVSVEGSRGSGGSGRSRDYSRRSTQVGPDFAFEIRGLPADMESRLQIVPGRLLAAQEDPFRLTTGARRDVEITLRFGGRASGRVIDEKGAGLPGVELSFEPEVFSIFYFQILDAQDFASRSSADGSFELFGLPSTKSRIHADLDGFVEGRSDPLELQDGEIRKGISIVMLRGHLVAGTVTWPDGSPARAAKVTASVEAPDDESTFTSIMRLRGHDTREAQTDERGEFAITGLQSGSIALFATALRAENATPPGQANEPGENLPKWSAVLENVAPDSVDLRLVLVAPVGLQGQVLDDLDRPVATFEITAHPPDDELERGRSSFRSTTTTKVTESKDGSFLIAGLQEGRWAIEVEAQGFVQTGEQPVVAVPRAEGPLVVRVERTGSVAGLVLDPAGAPVAGAEVSASRGSGGFLGSGEEMESTTTDEKGAFVIENLRVGNASLVARKEDQASSDPLPVRIEPEQCLEGQILRLRRGGRLTGEVFDLRGSRAAGRTVQVYGITGGDQRQATVDDSGNFAVESLSPGTYQIMLEPTQEDQERMMKSAVEGGEVNVSEFLASMKMTSAQIREGETTHVVIGAPPKAPVRLFGRVTRAGQPVREGFVVCVGEGGPVLSKLKMANVSATGDYELTLDEPGDVQLGFQEGASFGGGMDFGVTIPEAAEFRFDLELPTGGIRGIVRGADGRGLADVGVSLRRGGDLGSRWMSEGNDGNTTDGQGRFEFLGLAAGTYTVAAGGRGAFMEDEEPRWGRTVAGGLVVGKNEVLEGVELRLSAPCRISGTVRDANGSPLAEATVFARDERGQVVDSLSTCRTDADGSFTYSGVAAGSYTLFARTSTLASKESPPVAAREGETSRVELAALPGTVLVISFEDREGHRLRGSISVRDEHGREMTGMQGIESVESLLAEGVDTSVQRVGPLPPGAFQVSATAADGRSARKTVELRGQEERSVKLRAD